MTELGTAKRELLDALVTANLTLLEDERDEVATVLAPIFTELVELRQRVKDAEEAAERLRDRQRDVPVFHCDTHLCGSCAGCKRAGVLDDNTRLRAERDDLARRFDGLWGEMEAVAEEWDYGPAGPYAADLRAVLDRYPKETPR